MPSPFDFLSDSGDAISPFMPGSDPGFRRQMLFDTLTNAGLGLMAASAPSASPVQTSLGSMFGGLAGGALQGMQGSEDKYLKRMLTAAQVAQASEKVRQGQTWRDLFRPGGTTAPTDTGGFGPTPTGGAPTPLQPADGTGPNPNNIGNVRPVGATSGFQQPPDFNAGVHLAVNTVGAYPGQFNNGQPMSLLQIGERWAPKGDGANDPVQWAKNVSAVSGLPVDQPLDLAKPEVKAAFARGVHGAEWGANAVRPIADYATALTGGSPQPSVGGMPPPGGATPVQYQPQAAPQPKTLQDVIKTMPPGVRQMIGAMGPEAGMKEVLKYADPESVPAFDPRTNQMVFVPKTALGSGRYLPPDAGNFGLAQKRDARDAINAKVIPGPNGPQPNAPLLEYDKGVSQAQGTDAASKITVDIAQDAIKRNSDIQKSGLAAQGNLNRLNNLQTLLDQITTGKFTGTTTDLKAAAKAAGVDLEALGVKDNVGVTQAAAALTNLMALENRSEMPGPMSNADRDFLTAAAPSITKDPAGNRVLIEIKKGDLQRQADIAKAARDYIASPQFKTNPEGLDNYIAGKLEGKSYFDTKVLPQAKAQGKPGSLPMPNADGTPRIRRFNPATGQIE
jgi:hypothetical protein